MASVTVVRRARVRIMGSLLDRDGSASRNRLLSSTMAGIAQVSRGDSARHPQEAACEGTTAGGARVRNAAGRVGQKRPPPSTGCTQLRCSQLGLAGSQTGGATI